MDYEYIFSDNLIKKIENEKIKLWSLIQIKECEDSWALSLADTCSDSLICKFARIKREEYRKIMSEKFDIFFQGDITFFRKLEDVEEALEFVDSNLLMKELQRRQ